MKARKIDVMIFGNEDDDAFYGNKPCEFKAGALGVHLPHDGCQGYQLLIWQAEQGDVTQEGLLIVKGIPCNILAGATGKLTPKEADTACQMSLDTFRDHIDAFIRKQHNSTAMLSALMVEDIEQSIEAMVEMVAGVKLAKRLNRDLLGNNVDMGHLTILPASALDKLPAPEGDDKPNNKDDINVLADAIATVIAQRVYGGRDDRGN